MYLGCAHRLGMFTLVEANKIQNPSAVRFFRVICQILRRHKRAKLFNKTKRLQAVHINMYCAYEENYQLKTIDSVKS